MPLANARVSSPFGPLTLTVLPSMAIVTPFGIGTGSFPIRDIGGISLPDEGEQLAAGARLARFLVGHHALGGAEDRDAEAVADARDLGGADVLAQAGRRDALQLADDRLAARVLETDAQQLPAFLALERGEVGDEAVLLQNARDLDFHLRRRHVDAAMLGSAGIADPRQHVGDWVSHAHG